MVSGRPKGDHIVTKESVGGSIKTRDIVSADGKLRGRTLESDPDVFAGALKSAANVLRRRKPFKPDGF